MDKKLSQQEKDLVLAEFLRIQGAEKGKRPKRPKRPNTKPEAE